MILADKKIAMKKILISVAFVGAVGLIGDFANAARIKDIANVRGVRENQLIGYGLVVGLNGTGDGKAEFTSKRIIRMLDSVGMKLEGKDVQSKNVAALLITASLPPFARLCLQASFQ